MGLMATVKAKLSRLCEVGMPVRLLQCLSNSDRGISFRGSSLLVVRTSEEDNLCVDHYRSSTVHTTSVITFYKRYVTIFATARNKNGIGHSPDYFSPLRAKNGLGTRLVSLIVPRPILAPYAKGLVLIGTIVASNRNPVGDQSRVHMHNSC